MTYNPNERYWAARLQLSRSRTQLVLCRHRNDQSYLRMALEGILSACWLMGVES